MNELSFFITLALVIKVLQEIKTNRQHAQVCVEVKNFQAPRLLENLPGKRHATEKRSMA